MDGRFITVKGKGRFQAEPECAVILLELLTHAMEYENVARYAEERFEDLCKTLCSLGVARGSIITSNFLIDKNHEVARDQVGNYKRFQNGFICRHELRVELPFDMKLLSTILMHVSKSGASPDFPILFTIKGNSAISGKLLEQATADAREKAAVLAHACGVRLGKLVSVDYDLKDTYDSTQQPILPASPFDIELEDTVSFVWDIE